LSQRNSESFSYILLRAFRFKPKKEIGATALSWCALALVDIRLRLLPYKFNKKILDSEARNHYSADLSSRSLRIIQSISSSVNRAAQFPWIFDMSCLRRAVVIRRATKILVHREPILHYGIRRQNDGAIIAHAWLEIDGLSINCGVSPALFERFTDNAKS
jgi:hypothetical protein